MEANDLRARASTRSRPAEGLKLCNMLRRITAGELNGKRGEVVMVGLTTRDLAYGYDGMIPPRPRQESET